MISGLSQSGRNIIPFYTSLVTKSIFLFTPIQPSRKVYCDFPLARRISGIGNRGLGIGKTEDWGLGESRSVIRFFKVENFFRQKKTFSSQIY